MEFLVKQDSSKIIQGEFSLKNLEDAYRHLSNYSLNKNN
jgi:hypothetical protein